MHLEQPAIRTLVSCLGSKGNSRYTTPALNLWEEDATIPRSGIVASTPFGFAITQTLLTKDHQMEVSTLSRQGDRFIPYPHHYSEAFAFSILLYLLR